MKTVYPLQTKFAGGINKCPNKNYCTLQFLITLYILGCQFVIAYHLPFGCGLAISDGYFSRVMLTIYLGIITIPFIPGR